MNTTISKHNASESHLLAHFHKVMRNKARNKSRIHTLRRGIRSKVTYSTKEIKGKTVKFMKDTRQHM